MKPGNEPVSLFVVHWNQPAECIAAMEALGAQNIPLDPTVIDNDSERDAREILEARLGPEVELLRLDKNRGWGGALNVALKNWLERRTNRYCIISAHDAVPAPECLRLLIEAAGADPAEPDLAAGAADKEIGSHDEQTDLRDSIRGNRAASRSD